MKYFKVLRVFFLSSFVFSPAYLLGYDAKIDGIYYNLNETNNYATVTFKKEKVSVINDYKGHIVIPQYVFLKGKRYKVKYIGDFAFASSRLKSVIIPYGVETIGAYAFSGCFWLKAVSIPNSVKSIGESAFEGSSINNIVIPEGVKVINSSAFERTFLKSITLPSSVSYLGSRVFHYCGLDSIRILNDTIHLEKRTFEGASPRRVVIPETLILDKNLFGNNTIIIREEKGKNINEPRNTNKLATIELADLAEETTEREVTLRAGIKSDSYVSEVRVMLNGSEVEPADRGANVVKNDGNDRTITRRLTLREGSNNIKVIAKNGGGEATVERTIVYRVKNLPMLEWRNDIVSVGSSSYHLQLGVRSKSGIVSRTVMLNGKRIDEADRGANSVRNDGYDMVIDRYLSLSEGSNVIRVSVTNAEGTATAERLVTYTKPTPTERRIAIVIGNATYNNPCFPNLRNPLNDAKAMYNKFKTLGFDLMPILLNAGRTKMWNAIEEFVDSIEKGNYEVALIYYSGHGLSPDGGANYLIPTDASIKYVDEIKRDGLNSQTDLIAKLEKKKCRVKIALLDCCNNCNVPERGVKNAANLGGMAMMRPPHGISILHAAQPRRTAFDGNSSNSPFVEAFLECADKYADEPWQTFITQVTNLVDIKTKGEQIPYPEGQIRGKFFYLNPNHK